MFWGPPWMGLWFGPPWMRSAMLLYLIFFVLYFMGVSIFYYFWESEYCTRECSTNPRGYKVGSNGGRARAPLPP